MYVLFLNKKFNLSIQSTAGHTTFVCYINILLILQKRLTFTVLMIAAVLLIFTLMLYTVGQPLARSRGM